MGGVNGLKQDDVSAGEETWQGSGCIWKIAFIGINDGLDVGK